MALLNGDRSCERVDLVRPAEQLHRGLEKEARAKFGWLIFWTAMAAAVITAMAWTTMGVLTRFFVESLSFAMALMVHLAVALSYHFFWEGLKGHRPLQMKMGLVF